MQGGDDDDVYVMVQGEATVVRDDVLVGRAGPGQLIGEMAALYGMRRTATVVADQDMVVIRIPRQAYLDALAASQEAEHLAHEVAASYGVSSEPA